jgi:uncharacterized membrane protein
MKTKLGLFGIAVLTLFLCLTLVSAATDFSVSPSTITFTPTSASNDLTVTNINTSTPLSVTLTMPTINGILFQYSGNTSNINSSVLTITPTTTINFSEIGFGESFSGNLSISDGSETEIVTVRIENNRFCECSNPGDLKVKIENINNEGIGTDDEWYPYDILEIEVEVENDGNEDIKDIKLEWGVYDSNGDWIINPVDEDEFDVDEDDTEIVKFKIDFDDDLDVDFDELKDSDYDLYVRATGEREDSGDNTCASDSENIDVKIEDDYVILTDLEVVGTPFCGSLIQVKANVLNIGEDDQEDVYVMIYNTDLEVNEKAIIGDIDAFEDKKLSFEFTVPTNLEEKKYSLHFDVYDEDGDIYESSDNDESTHTLHIDVSGNCERVADATVYASLESGGKAGQEMEIRASVTNTGSEKKTFTIEAADYSEWAELVDIEPSTLTLDKDETKDVIITLNVDSDAPEDASFSIVLEDEDGETLTQPISATIEKGFSLKGLFGDKGYIWGIAILNVLLILIIIIVAIRVARR